AEDVGGFRSTLLPVIGPAVAQFPTTSHTWCEPVEAFAFSVPAATVVVSEKLASAEAASPEPVSDAVQASETFWACQAESAAAQLSCGAARSTLLPPIGPAVAQLPATSHTWRDPVAAFELWEPAATLVLRGKLASAGLARREPVC